MRRLAVRSAAVLVLVGIVSVSAVGTSSAAFRGENGKLTLQVFDFSRANVSVNIGIVNPNGSGFRLLTNNRPGGAAASLAAWSPNGQKLAFDLQGPNGSGIWVMNPDGSGKQLVALDDRGDRLNEPFWATNDRIVFTRLAPSGPSSIWTVSADGDGAARQLIAAPDKATSLGHPAVSPDGNRILVTESTGSTTRLAIAHRDGTDLHSIPGTARIDASAGDFSPNGRWIVTSNNSTNGKVSSLVVLHPDGSHAHQITHPGGHSDNDLYPVWSPDGTKLAFTRSPCPQPAQGCYFAQVAVWIANANGRHAHPIIGPSNTADYLISQWGPK